MTKLSDVEEVIYQKEISDVEFAKQVIEECKYVDVLFTVRCRICKQEYNLLKVKFEDGNPVCSHCGQS
jgi:hypothetical protein